MDKNSIVLLGCGDVGPIHEPVAAYSTLAQPALAGADIRFAQIERIYSDRGALQLHAGVGHSRVKPHMASLISDCGFDVVSFASNHAMDWGVDAFHDTIENIRKNGARVAGAGRNLKEARQPVIIERNGVRVAFLAYCSILNEGYAAGPDKPGIAPLRINTYYEARENQPGTPPRIVTIPHKKDLADAVEDIANAKKDAHIVVLSLHWGIHGNSRMMAEYQPEVAMAAFAAGADLILGHHAHIPKAIGVHAGKVCFYSLGNFIMSAPEKTPAQVIAFRKHYGVDLDPDYPHLPYGPDAKRSLMAKAVLARDGVKKVSFLPLQIDKQLRPEVLKHGDPRFDEVVNHWDWVSEDFDHKFVVEGDEVVVTAT
jgi:poly-gamma-glutamate synthesis protein (capsule biosynthesis protein)